MSDVIESNNTPSIKDIIIGVNRPWTFKIIATMMSSTGINDHTFIVVARNKAHAEKVLAEWAGRKSVRLIRILSTDLMEETFVSAVKDV